MTKDGAFTTQDADNAVRLAHFRASTLTRVYSHLPHRVAQY